MQLPANAFKARAPRRPPADWPVARTRRCLRERAHRLHRVRLAGDRCRARAERPAQRARATAGAGAVSGAGGGAHAVRRCDAASSSISTSAHRPCWSHGGVGRAGGAASLRRRATRPPASAASAARWHVLRAGTRSATTCSSCAQEICVLVQVESALGLENLPAIAATEGVDGVFFGPADLAASLGLLGKHRRPRECRRRSCGASARCAPPERPPAS